MVASKKTTKVVKTKKVEESSNSLLSESIELSEAVVKEIDNLMKSKLQPGQVGKILGDIISSFSKQVQELKERS